MKCFLVLCMIGLVTLSMADKYYEECIYIEGRCVEACPKGTYSYTTGCNRKMPEATCDQPQPVLEEGAICDYSACYCNSPTVRDTKTGKCVPLDQCTKNTEKEKENQHQDVQEK